MRTKNKEKKSVTERKTTKVIPSTNRGAVASLSRNGQPMKGEEQNNGQVTASENLLVDMSRASLVGSQNQIMRFCGVVHRPKIPGRPVPVMYCD